MNRCPNKTHLVLKTDVFYCLKNCVGSMLFKTKSSAHKMSKRAQNVATVCKTVLPEHFSKNRSMN